MKPQNTSLVFVLLLDLLVSTYAMSGEWTWQNPLPQGNVLKAIQFVDENNGWAVGNLGTILGTTDGGKNWSQQISGTNSELNYISFVNTRLGWIASNNGILHTTDGGNKWYNQLTGKFIGEFDKSILGGSGYSIKEVHFTNATNGWAIGWSTFLRTTNGGATWSVQYLNSAINIEKMIFIDVNTGWAFLDAHSQNQNEILVGTTDGGSTWKLVKTFTTYISTFTFCDRNNGWIASRKFILHTNDGGNNWDTVKFKKNEEYNYKRNILGEAINDIAIWKMYFLDKNNGWAIPNRDENSIAFTTNGGKSWYLRKINNLQYSTASFSFNNAKLGWAIYGSTISQTTDGGDHWENLSNSTTHDLRGIAAIDSNTAWAYGTEGAIVHTTNGGNDWKQENCPTRSQFLCASLIDSNHGWLAGSNGTIVHTTNGGGTWNFQISGITNGIVSISFSDSLNGWAIANGNYIRDDKVPLWKTNLVFGEKILFGLIEFVFKVSGNESHIPFAISFNDWFVHSYFLHTTDGGNHWTKEEHSNLPRLTDIHFTDKEHGWIVGKAGTVLKTTNTGKSWSVQSKLRDGYDHFYSIAFSDKFYGYIARYGGLLRTTDGGNSWKEFPLSDKGRSFELASYIDSDNIWCFFANHDKRELKRTTDGGITWTNSDNILNRSIHQLAFPDPNHGWAVGDNGMILRYSNNK